MESRNPSQYATPPPLPPSGQSLELELNMKELDSAFHSTLQDCWEFLDLYAHDESPATTGLYPDSESYPRASGGTSVAAEDAAHQVYELHPPEKGATLESIRDTLFRDYDGGLLAKGLFPISGAYMSYIPGGGLMSSALGEMIAAIVNKYTGCAFLAQPLAMLEGNVIRWLCSIMGYDPQAAFGCLLSGGSMSNLCGVITARDVKLGREHAAEISKGVAYASDQAHHSVLKSFMCAGIARDRIHLIPTTEDLKMDPIALEAAIVEDRKKGLRPFLVVATGGTTNAGVVDDLVTIAGVCHSNDIWLHVDAAYGGFFHLTERGKKVLRGVELADSIVCDPHKTLFLPYGTGCLLVKDHAKLQDVYSYSTSYVSQAYFEKSADWKEAPDFSQLSPEMSREFRGLKLWLPFKLHGVRAFRDYLDEKLDLTAWATNELSRTDGIVVTCSSPPQLTVITFQADVPAHVKNSLGEEEQLDMRNEATMKLLQAVNQRNRVHLSHAWVKRKNHKMYVMRFCIVNVRTHAAHVSHAVDDVRAGLMDVHQEMGWVDRE